jgi:hypothetical protein
LLLAGIVILETQFAQRETQGAALGEPALRQAQAKKSRYPAPDGAGIMRQEYAEKYREPNDYMHDSID